MKLAKQIFNEDGRVLLGKHMELSASLILRLKSFGISYLYIHDPLTEDVDLKDILSEETRIQATQIIRTHFRKKIMDSMKTRVATRHDLGSQFKSMLDGIIDDLSQNQDAMIMMGDIQVSDNYLFRHSLNVCIYSILLAMKSGYTRQEVSAIGLGALLHDIGKMKVSQEALNKPGRLTEEEFLEIQRHTEIGYQMLKDEPNIPLLSAHCALQHHERLNGSGYPRGLKGKEIHDYALWVGMVDSYDAMTTHRIYRPAMLPHQAMEVIYAGSNDLFDKQKIELFRDKIAIYPLGLDVTLNTGQRGVVVDLNSTVPHRPVIRVLEDEEGVELSAPFEIDLSKKLSIMVTSVNSLATTPMMPR